MNLDLSQARAEAVRSALIDRGAAPSQLVAQGYGETQPIADNGSEAGREVNRRIAFTLVGGEAGEAGDDDAEEAGAEEAGAEDAAGAEAEDAADASEGGTE